MARTYLTPTLEIDLASVRDAAEQDARAKVASNAETAAHWRLWGGGTPPEPWTPESAYAFAYAQHLDRAKGERETTIFLRDRDAALERMSARERRIHDLCEAAHLAPMIDDSVRARAEQDAAEQALAELLAEPV